MSRVPLALPVLGDLPKEHWQSQKWHTSARQFPMSTDGIAQDKERHDETLANSSA
jgi:hypothetical protein